MSCVACRKHELFLSIRSNLVIKCDWNKSLSAVSTKPVVLFLDRSQMKGSGSVEGES